MGSSSSTHVQSIDGEYKQQGKIAKRRDDGVSGKNEVTLDQVKPLSAGKKRTKVGVHENAVQQVQKQDDPNAVADNDLQLANLENRLEREHTELAEVERQNLELQDYIENLESQLEAVDRENETRDKGVDFTETLKIKEQELQKLEKEKETLNTEMTKMRVKFKKKIRLLNTKLAEQKNEGSIQALELREEINVLTEENSKLNERLQSGFGVDEKQEDRPLHNSESHNHTGVILELSSRVSEQDARITELENILREKNREIERMQQSVKTQRVKENTSLPNEIEHYNAKTGKWGNVSNADLNLDEGTDWYGNKTFEQISRQTSANNLTPISSSRSYPGRSNPKHEDTDSTKSELQAIAEEMKQLRKKKPKSKRSQAATRSPVHREIENEGELSGRDSGLSVDSQHHSPISASAPNIGANRTGSGKRRTPSVLSNDSWSNSAIPNKTPQGGISLLERPPSGGIRYDADISQCDTDMGLSDKSDNELEYEDSEASRSTPLGRSSIRQISAPKNKKRKGLLRSLVRKDSADFNSSTQDASGSETAHRKPPVYKVKSKDQDVEDAETLLKNLDHELLVHKSNPIGLTAVS